MSKLTKAHMLGLTLTVSDILKFKVCNFQRVYQGHGVQFSQWHHSMANVKIYKRLPYIFALALTFQRYYNFNFFTFKE